MINEVISETKLREIAQFLQFIVRTDGQEPLAPLSEFHGLVRLVELPRARTTIAKKLGAEKNILLKLWGGLGDQLCAAPAAAFIFKEAKRDGCTVSLASECDPYFFSHIPFDKVFDLREVTPNYEKFFPFEMIVPQDTALSAQFFRHLITNCVDYPALCSFGRQIPVADKEMRLTTRPPKGIDIDFQNTVFIHPGKHWQSKTFPKDFWDGVIEALLSSGAKVALIGANSDANRGTVDVDATNCLDLRNKLDAVESCNLLQRAHVVLTNDSAPLHMAASGDAFIGYVATCKHPDFITHWRNGQWGYKMKNFGKGGVWENTPFIPNIDKTFSVENVGDEELRKWLPDPREFASWAKERLNGH